MCLNPHHKSSLYPASCFVCTSVMVWLGCCPWDLSVLLYFPLKCCTLVDFNASGEVFLHANSPGIAVEYSLTGLLKRLRLWLKLCQMVIEETVVAKKSWKLVVWMTGSVLLLRNRSCKNELITTELSPEMFAKRFSPCSLDHHAYQLLYSVFLS